MPILMCFLTLERNAPEIRKKFAISISNFFECVCFALKRAINKWPTFDQLSYLGLEVVDAIKTDI